MVMNLSIHSDFKNKMSDYYYMPKSKQKTKTKSKTKKPRSKKKDNSLNVAIQLNKQLNISNLNTDEDIVEKREKLIENFMKTAKLHQEYSEKLEELDLEMNKYLSEILVLENKYSSIDDFIKTNGWDVSQLKQEEEKQNKNILDSFDEN